MGLLDWMAGKANKAIAKKYEFPSTGLVPTAGDLDADVLVTSDRNWPTRRALRLRARLVLL